MARIKDCLCPFQKRQICPFYFGFNLIVNAPFLVSVYTHSSGRPSSAVLQGPHVLFSLPLVLQTSLTLPLSSLL